jgi:hypothetical protein
MEINIKSKIIDDASRDAQYPERGMAFLVCIRMTFSSRNSLISGMDLLVGKEEFLFVVVVSQFIF